ncbi:phosphate acetyltransferase [Candidatus Woesearchaeota archaeon]|nr:phosphate acetyltransferase [Candidatus Woesearchaeota archaeon]
MKIDLISIMEKVAKKKLVKVVVCEGWDERCLKAADDVLKNKLASLILLGNPDEVNAKAKELGVDIKEAEIVDYKNSDLKKELAEKLVEVRKHKGMTLDQANKLIEDENYFGVMYCYAGHADAVAGSAIGSTAALMRPALQILREKGKLVSEVSTLTDVKNDRTFFGTDFSLNIDPSAEDLAQITLNAVDVVRSFEIEPKVALLSFSTKGSGGDTPQTELVRKAVEIMKEKDSELLIDGELQVDAAVNPKVAPRKCPDSPLKGEANVLIFPNLTASNIFAHGLGQFSDMTLDFTILSGLQKPVAILGRSTPMESVRNMIVSCAFQVNAK